MHDDVTIRCGRPLGIRGVRRWGGKVVSGSPSAVKTIQWNNVVIMSASVEDVWPTLKQHCFSASCLLGDFSACTTGNNLLQKNCVAVWHTGMCQAIILHAKNCYTKILLCSICTKLCSKLHRYTRQIIPCTTCWFHAASLLGPRRRRWPNMRQHGVHSSLPAPLPPHPPPPPAWSDSCTWISPGASQCLPPPPPPPLLRANRRLRRWRNAEDFKLYYLYRTVLEVNYLFHAEFRYRDTGTENVYALWNFSF